MLTIQQIRFYRWIILTKIVAARKIIRAIRLERSIYKFTWLQCNIIAVKLEWTLGRAFIWFIFDNWRNELLLLRKHFNDKFPSNEFIIKHSSRSCRRLLLRKVVFCFVFFITAPRQFFLLKILYLPKIFVIWIKTQN